MFRTVLFRVLSGRQQRHAGLGEKSDASGIGRTIMKGLQMACLMFGSVPFSDTYLMKL